MLATLGKVSIRAAAFDPRLDGPAAFTGRASKSIGRKLGGRHGRTVIAKPESFLVTNANGLEPGEQDRAGRWNSQLASEVTLAGGSPASS